MSSEDPEGSSGAEPTETRSGLLASLGRAPWGELAGVAAVFLGAVVLFFVFVAEPPLSPRLTAGIAPGMAQRLMALPPTPTRAASIHFEDTHPGQRIVREEGAAVRMSFQIEQPGRVLVIEERHGLHLVQLFPAAGRPSVPVPPGQRIEVTDPSGRELVVGFPRGLRRVRLFLFPEDVDPLALQPTELGRLRSQLLVIERNYKAGRRGEGRM
jgi:hypothetical protein